MGRWGVVAGLLAVLVLAGCTSERVGGEPDRVRSTSANLGPTDLAIPVEFARVLATVPSGTTTPPGAIPSASALPDPDGNELTLDEPFLVVTRLEGAEVKLDENSGTFLIAITMTDDDGATFGKWTTDHVGEQVAMVVDGELISAPQIADPILGGEVQITAQFDRTEAEDLLNAITGR